MENLIYEAKNVTVIVWDGTLKGKQLNMDSFIYAAEFLFIDGYKQTVGGTVHIVR